jgi:large subunit ribosomal protein L25
MANLFELSAEIRLNHGKAASRRFRRLNNKVPAIVYGANKEPLSILINHHHINNALKNEAFYSHILTINVNNSAEKVVLKALQRHPSKPQILHADFLRVSANEKLHMNIPLHFVNEENAYGVKIEGGVVSRLMNEVEIRCLPADLPEFIEVDLTDLKNDETLHLSQLKVSAGVEIVSLLHGGEDRGVVNIHRRIISEEPEAPIVVPSAEVPLVGKEEQEGEGEE